MRNNILNISMLLLTCILTASSVSYGQKAVTGAVIKFDYMVYDYGIMKEGDIKECSFTFKNIGDAPVIIQHVEEPCGCTVPSWSKEPVMPGKTGEIKVVYHSKDRPGVFRKTLAVKTNAVQLNHEDILLMIKGNALTNKEWKQKNKTTLKSN